MISSKKIIFISVSITFYLIALFLPCVSDSNLGKTENGFTCIALGWLTYNSAGKSLVHLLVFISWLSNLPFFTGLFIFIFSRKRKGFKIASIFLLPALFMACGVFMPGKDSLSAKIGCFTWIISQLVLFIGAFTLHRDPASIPAHSLPSNQNNS